MALRAVDGPAFEEALMQATGGAAGDLKLASERAAWSLQLGRADRWCGPGWALLGDAAHVVHPLAGQGLNLGLADVATLARVIGEREPWRPIGDERLLRRYARERAAPTWAMGEVTDGLLRLFSHDSSALRELRNRGLTLVNQFPTCQALARKPGSRLLKAPMSKHLVSVLATAVLALSAQFAGRPMKPPSARASPSGCPTFRRSTRSRRRRSPASTSCGSAPRCSTPTSRATT